MNEFQCWLRGCCLIDAFHPHGSLFWAVEAPQETLIVLIVDSNIGFAKNIRECSWELLLCLAIFGLRTRKGPVTFDIIKTTKVMARHAKRSCLRETRPCHHHSIALSYRPAALLSLSYFSKLAGWRFFRSWFTHSLHVQSDHDCSIHHAFASAATLYCFRLDNTMPYTSPWPWVFGHLLENEHF